MKTTQMITAIAAVLALSACDTTAIDGSSTGANGGVGSTGNSFGSQYGTVGEIAPGVADRVFFGYDSAAIDADSQDVLARQAAWLNQNPSVNITVEGHCDERGTREYNIALGERRAYSAKKFLVSQGVSSNRISTVSYGKERPAAIGSNSSAWGENRRAVTVAIQ